MLLHISTIPSTTVSPLQVLASKCILCSEGLRRDSFCCHCRWKCFHLQVFVKHLLGPRLSGFMFITVLWVLGLLPLILEMSKLRPLQYDLCTCVFTPLLISSFIYSFVYPFHKYLLSPFSVPDAPVRNNRPRPCPSRVCVPVGETASISKQSVLINVWGQ